MRHRWQDVLFALIAAAALAMAGLTVLVWQGHFVDDGTEAAPAGTTAPPAGGKNPPQPPAPAVARPAPAPPAQPVAHTTASVLRVQIVATRGDCWVAAYAGSLRGAQLVGKVLRQGETVIVRGRRIVLELGAAGNVDVSVNGKRRPIPSGTTNVVVG